MIGLTIEELAIGDTAELTRTITPETIREFVGASGDDNPIHSDESFGAATRFGHVIAPGMLTGGLVSAVIGTRLPGPGTIYLSQSFRFLRPVYPGDRITAQVEVSEIVREKNRLRLSTACVNQDGDPVVEGEAWVMPSSVHIDYSQATEPAREAAPPLVWAPTALAMQVMAFWMAAGLNLGVTWGVTWGVNWTAEAFRQLGGVPRVPPRGL